MLGKCLVLDECSLVLALEYFDFKTSIHFLGLDLWRNRCRTFGIPKLWRFGFVVRLSKTQPAVRPDLYCILCCLQVHVENKVMSGVGRVNSNCFSESTAVLHLSKFSTGLDWFWVRVNSLNHGYVLLTSYLFSTVQI